MYSIYELGIKTHQVAGWTDSQGWIFVQDGATEIKSMEILSVSSKSQPLSYSVLTQDQQNDVYASGEEFGEYLSGFLAVNEIEDDTYNEYLVKFIITFDDETQKLGFVNIAYYFDGGQGGYI